MSEGGEEAKPAPWARLKVWSEPERKWCAKQVKATRALLEGHRVARWPLLAGAVGLATSLAWACLAALGLSTWSPAPWWAWTGFGAIAIGLAAAYWLGRFEPNRNKQGQFAPRLQRQWLAISAAIAFAIAFEWVLFGLLLSNDTQVANPWEAPWRQVYDLNLQSESLVQPALALLTPVIALVTAVFAYRKSTIALAEAQRADVAAFQQRFIDAAKLLADPNASTRIAGATAMGSLARDWVENRQECVDVLCGYLKVKPAVDQLETLSDDLGQSYLWHMGEDVVRNEVVDQLRRTFTPAKASEATQHIVDLDLDAAWIPGGADFSGAHFQGTAAFGLVHFTGTSKFEDVEFGGPTWFEAAEFARAARFARSKFTQQASFEDARFRGFATFDGAQFNHDAWFERVTFVAEADFALVRFKRDAWFDGVDFKQAVSFRGSEFQLNAWFAVAKFGADAAFDDVTFCSPVRMDGARFTATYPSPQDDEVALAREPLGPLHKESQSPEPPGSLVDAAGVALRDAEWSRAGPD